MKRQCLLDTSALLRWTLDKEKLSEAAARAISESNLILVSSISFWEIALKHKQGKLGLPYPVREYAAKLQASSHTRIMPVELEVWLRSVALNWTHQDPADRVIVATAELGSLDLVTSDRKILDFYQSSIW